MAEPNTRTRAGRLRPRPAAAGLALALLAGPAAGQGLDTEALAEIRSFAESFCGDLFDAGGSSESLALEGAAKAEIDGLLKKLVSIGVEGAASFDSGEYVGVLREQLSAERSDNRDCRMTIWNDLKAGVVSAPAPLEGSGLPASGPTASSRDIVGFFPFTARVRLSPADLAPYGAADLRVMRNEIYARRGYAFRDAGLQSLFASQPWYVPVTASADAAWAAMSELERANVETIRAAEAAR